MKVHTDCIPCFARQTVEALEVYAPEDAAQREQLIRAALRIVAEADYSITPPEVAAAYFREFMRITGNADPFAAAKQRSNEEVMALLPTLRERIQASSNPLEMALRMAIAGNIIDFGTPHGKKDNALMEDIEHALAADMCMKTLSAFERAVEEARTILYLGDNCGEAVLDRLLLEVLPHERVTYAVRGKPILNDMTRVEVPQVGIEKICRIVDNGADIPGTVLAACSAEFRAAFDRADLIVSKGQGNFETLHDAERDIFFLMKVKCAVVAEYTGQPLGSLFFQQR